MRSLTSGSTSGLPVLRSTNSAIGTPQARWRLSTQSGRPSTIEPIRLRPFSGTKRVSAMACIASWRSVGVRPVERAAFVLPALLGEGRAMLSLSGWSIGTNHCGVQR